MEIGQGISASDIPEEAPGSPLAYTPTEATLGPVSASSGRPPQGSFATAEGTRLPLFDTDSTRVAAAAGSAETTFVTDSVRAFSVTQLGSSGDGGNSDGQARRDAEDFKTNMAKIRGAIQQLLNGVHGRERRELLSSLIAQTDTQRADADEVLQAGPGQPPDRAFRLAAGHAALVDDVKNAQAEAEDKEEGHLGKDQEMANHSWREALGDDLAAGESQGMVAHRHRRHRRAGFYSGEHLGDIRPLTGGLRPGRANFTHGAARRGGCGMPAVRSARRPHPPWPAAGVAAGCQPAATTQTSGPGLAIGRPGLRRTPPAPG